jgi:hypothetical protein
MIFKAINIYKILLWWCTPYFGVNSNQQISLFYKYLACFVQPLQPQWDSFDTWRQRTKLLAQCTFTKQLQNVLNILYAPSHINNPQSGGIYFNDVSYYVTSAPAIYYNSTTYAYSITDTNNPITFAPSITDNINFSQFIIFVPSAIWAANSNQIIADVALVAVDGIFYTFQTY